MARWGPASAAHDNRTNGHGVDGSTRGSTDRSVASLTPVLARPDPRKVVDYLCRFNSLVVVAVAVAGARWASGRPKEWMLRRQRRAPSGQRSCWLRRPSSSNEKFLGHSSTRDDRRQAAGRMIARTSLGLALGVRRAAAWRD